MFCEAMEVHTVLHLVVVFAWVMPVTSKSLYSGGNNDIRKSLLASRKVTGNVDMLQAHEGYKPVSVLDYCDFSFVSFVLHRTNEGKIKT